MKLLVLAAVSPVVVSQDIFLSSSHAVSSESMNGSPLQQSVGEAPLWPEMWHANFEEYTRMFNPFKAPGKNTGSIHYDWKKQRLLWKHGKGQSDNWCQCAGLKTDEECHVLFSKTNVNPDGALYTMFPGLQKCCSIGPWSAGEGFRVHPSPDWLRTGQNTTGLVTSKTEKINGKTCTTWSWNKPGDYFTMNSDDWSVDENGLPCRYQDHFKWLARAIGMTHHMDFDDSTYSAEAEDDSVFALPDDLDCSAPCPNKQGWCKGH